MKHINDIAQKIDNFLKTTNLKTSVKSELVLGIAGDALVENAAENGLNIKGFSHSIDNFFVNHTLNQHGNINKENARGNVPVTEEDIKMIPEVLQNPDYLIYGTKTKTGNNAILFAKNINGSTIFVEEVRNGKMKLAAQTLYKLPRTIDVSFLKNAPELYAHSDPGTIKIVDVRNDIVNRMFITSEKKNNLKIEKNQNDLSLEEKLEQAKKIIQEKDKIIEKQNKILNEEYSIEVNGVTRTCERGILKGFESAVEKIDTLNQRNKELTSDYNKLAKSQNQNVSPKSPADDGTWSD